MIELIDDRLSFRFPAVHPDARLHITLHRTLRIPDDDRTYPLPPGLGAFPLSHVDDHAERVPGAWLDRGGVVVPMYQAEAMWVGFTTPVVDQRSNYPFVVKIATGKINAVTGEAWSDGVHRDPQDYVVVPRQPWLDGYCVEKGVIRQFVAMPLGAGYSAEEQITGRADHGGLQIVVYPMKRDVFERRFPQRVIARRSRLDVADVDSEMCFGGSAAAAPDMGLAPGGRMRQEIYDDPFDFDDWDLRHSSRCFVHLANSMVWQSITGKAPPSPPPTAADYDRAGLPWFDYYGDGPTLGGGGPLKRLKSVFALGNAKGDVPLPENESTSAKRVIDLRAGLRDGQVREW